MNKAMDISITRICFSLSVLIFSLTSCASQNDVIYLNNQVKALYQQSKETEKSVNELEEKVKAHASLQQEVKRMLNENKNQESIRLHLAQAEADLMETRDEVRELTGKVEENSHLLKRSIEEDTTETDTMVTKISDLSSVVDELKQRMGKIESSLGLEPSINRKRAGLEERVSPVQKAPQKATSPPQKKELTESEIYDKALGYYRNERYEEAKSEFNDFVRLYPKSDLADNAYFWIGECHKGLKNYEEAILAYQKVINSYPKGNKVPSAMLQQALTFEKINDHTTANLVLKKLAANFPNTEEAGIARKRLKQE